MGESGPKCEAESSIEREFPALYDFLCGNPFRRPDRERAWERHLRVARESEPILAAARQKGLNLVVLNQNRPLGVDPQPLYEAILDWLPRLRDPLTVAVGVARLLEPEAKPLLRRKRAELLQVTREWCQRQRHGDLERALSALAQCVMKVARPADLPEILQWASDRTLPVEARLTFTHELHRFARKPGTVRDLLTALTSDEEVGNQAVWALGRAAGVEALPLLRELLRSSPHESVRKAAKHVTRKLEAKLLRVELPQSDPAKLPGDYFVASIEIDTEQDPGFLATLTKELPGRLEPGAVEQLVLSANQLRRGQRRSYVVPLVAQEGALQNLGFGLFAEDEDVTLLEIYCGGECQGAVERAFASFAEQNRNA